MKKLDIYKIVALEEAKKSILEDSFLFKKAISRYEFHNRMRQYYLEYFGANYIDNSIVCFLDNKPCILLFAFCKVNEFNYFNMPCEILSDFDDKVDEPFVFKMFTNYLKDYFAENDVKVKFHENPYITKSFIDNIGKIEPWFYGGLKLSGSDEDVFRNIRKSYKSLINWGKINLKLYIVSTSDPNKDLFLKFKELHKKAAGRSTRSDESWELQFEMIKDGAAFLVLGFLNNSTLVTGAYVLYGDGIAFYGVAASDRQHMAQNLPLAHWPVMKSILFAKELGMHYFSFEVLELHSTDSKLLEIIKFKKGFCTEIKVKPVLYLENFKSKHKQS